MLPFRFISVAATNWAGSGIHRLARWRVQRSAGCCRSTAGRVPSTASRGSVARSTALAHQAGNWKQRITSQLALAAAGQVMPWRRIRYLFHCGTLHRRSKPYRRLTEARHLLHAWQTAILTSLYRCGFSDVPTFDSFSPNRVIFKWLL